MESVNIHSAKTNLSKLIEAVLNGEKVIIAKNNVPVVQIVPIKKTGRGRIFGSAKGRVSMRKDFDAPVEDFQEYMK
jgi:prevent-host-death family protein